VPLYCPDNSETLSGCGRNTHAVAELKNNLLVLSVAAQNGFFWQTIIDKLGEEKTKIVLTDNFNRLKGLLKNSEMDSNNKDG
jgi:hypothetical protein